MKYIISLFSLIIFALSAETTLAANFSPPTDVMVVAGKSVELDVTMEMLDEHAESSSDIINVIELPVQEMYREQLRNKRHIRQDGAASPLRQEQGPGHDSQSEIKDQMSEIQQEAADARRQAADDMGPPSKGR